jgi:hypothetical protein
MILLRHVWNLQGHGQIDFFMCLLALTSPTSGGLSVGIVRLRTKATEFILLCLSHCFAFLLRCSVTWLKLVPIIIGTNFNYGNDITS